MRAPPQGRRKGRRTADDASTHQRTGRKSERYGPPGTQLSHLRPAQKVQRWVEELPAVLWSLRTTPNRSIGFTLFFLIYGAEAVLPSDLDYGAPRGKAFDPDRAAEAQQDAVDLLEEARETALVRSASYQQTLHRYQERKIRGRTLEVSNLMLRRTQLTKDKHKLTPP
jgi:hypothetical protein